MFSRVPGSQAKTHDMTDFGWPSPRRYFVDQIGRRVLIGLTVEETFEFETLDCAATLEESDNHAGPEKDGIPTITQEPRWRELYGKHDTAWRQWMIESCADRSADLRFINHDSVI